MNSSAAGRRVLVQAQLTLKPDSVVGFATGSTPLGLYRLLAQARRRGEMDASGITAVNLDEYYPLSPGHPQSYRTFMQHHVWRPLGLRRIRPTSPGATRPTRSANAAAMTNCCAAWGRWICSCWVWGATATSGLTSRAPKGGGHPSDAPDRIHPARQRPVFFSRGRRRRATR